MIEYLEEHPEELYAKNDDRLLPKGVDWPIYELPTYKDMNHKEIMRFYVKETVYEKDVRKKLFDILKNDDYMNKYIDNFIEYEMEFADEWF